jgi:hypothetical protein
MSCPLAGHRIGLPLGEAMRRKAGVWMAGSSPAMTGGGPMVHSLRDLVLADIPQIAVGSIVSLRRLTGFDKPDGPSRLVDGNSGGRSSR